MVFRSISCFIATLLFLAACSTSDQSAKRADGPEESSAVSLLGTSWQLVEIRSMNDFVYTPLSVERYTLDFLPGGQLLIRADCNRGQGNWQQDGSQLLVDAVVLTRAMCRPESIDQRFLTDLEHVRSFVLRDGRLYLATLADGAIMEFEARRSNYSIGGSGGDRAALYLSHTEG